MKKNYPKKFCGNFFRIKFLGKKILKKKIPENIFHGKFSWKFFLEERFFKKNLSNKSFSKNSVKKRYVARILLCFKGMSLSRIFWIKWNSTLLNELNGYDNDPFHFFSKVNNLIFITDRMIILFLRKFIPFLKYTHPNS